MSRGAIIAASFGASAGLAVAGDAKHGWYFGLEGGASFVKDVSMGGTPNTYSFDTGLAALGVVGFKFRSPLRFEFEAGYRDNDIGEVNGLSAANGGVKELTGFANLLWDHPLQESNWGLVLGAGLGGDNVRFKDQAGVDSREVVPAVQAIVGLNYTTSNHWEYTINYRLLYADDGNYDTTVGLGTVNGDTHFLKHAITIGFHYGYDEPPPPPAPAAPPPPPPAPPPVKQFIVFFGFNKSNITAEAQAVIAEAAGAAKTQGSARIVIVGHTDTVGSNAYNDKLSVRRADAVKGELAGLGISPDAITASGKGESELMVQTGDGVKEPQNRRATIDLN